MAKAIPKKKSAVKKKSTSEILKAATVTEKLAELEVLSAARAEWVDKIMEANDETLARALDVMVEQLENMEGPPKLVIGKQTVPVSESEFKLLVTIQNRNFRWISLRCIVACAEWGIRIANFKAPSNLCVRCGKKVKK